MGNRIENRIILGSLRYKSAPDRNSSFTLPLIQTSKQNTEFDRSLDVNLEQVFDNERQKSDNFRPSCKFTLIFKNSYSGFTNYVPYENNLYYLNADVAAAAQCLSGSTAVSWTGLPQYNEFDFIRNDYNISGYTQPPNEHLTFVPKSASSYNWNFYMTYAYDNDYTKNMTFFDKKSNQYVNWVCGDGIPFVVGNSSINGLGIIEFRCPSKHGLNVGEFVKLNFSYNGKDLFQVDSLGNDAYGSEEYIFNIINVGYTGTTFNIGQVGTFKRVILGDNVTDSISKYYVRKHKVLTSSDNTVMAKCGFEENIFGIKKKYESSGFTPNQTSRVSVKEGAQSYSLSFNQDIRINPIRDNQKRPISELFFTVIWKGYFGWTLGPLKPSNQGIAYYGLQQGWEFNLPLNPNTKLPNNWWANTNSNSESNIPVNTYATTLQGFVYTETLNIGDTLDGDYCEWNDYDQMERVISIEYHKFKFNQTKFNIGTSLGQSPLNNFGYYYQPHYSLNIKDYSNYIEEGDIQNVVGIPDYSYFSTSKNLFIWRDLYPYGFIDNDGIGVNYPFLNGTHYPYENIIFRIIPEGSNYKEQTIIASPIIDNCE